MKYLISLPVVSLLVLVSSCARQNCCFEDNVVKQTYIHRYGLEVPGEAWTESGKDGTVISILATGVKMTKSYAGGQLDGPTTYTYPHSETIEKIETYSQGILVSEVSHFSSGVPKKEVQYIAPTEQKITFWYENSTPRSIERYKDGLLISGDYYNADHKVESHVADGNGTRMVRDDYGLVISSDNIVNGKIATSQVLYPNGAPRETIPYANGVIEGQKKTFLPAGEPNSIENWVAGVQQGVTLVFQNGEKIAEVPYINGHKEGVERRFRDGGQKLVEEISWKDGIQHGPAYTYVEGAKSVSWHYQGRPVNKSIFDRLSRPR